ncbi:hypothetical protein B0A55_03397 [Friedmanniomyces simplex]|uniref:Nitrogen permease regulator 3 n=1 Tax=Friedmanniomyces simplex TaxID=329884 RepID=A0A4U0XS59_9PEZI|nr:hypothetical protein B0A55_03397 [Friedmanniomyces simplex]
MDPPRHSREAKLIAVLLITRSRSGPRLVFHYPSVPQAISTRTATDDTDDDASDLDSETGVGDVDSDQLPRVDRSLVGPFDANLRHCVDPEIDFEHDASSSDDLLGYSVSDRKKFEVCVDGITLVGHPVYARDDGGWSSNPATSRVISTLDPGPSRHGDGAPNSETANITITAPGSPAKVFQDYTHMPDSLESRHALSLGTSMESTSTASGVPAEHMAMFHIVFVVRGDEQTYATAVHEHVAKKLSKALHHCQKQHDFVTLESRKILALKAKAKQHGTSSGSLLTHLVEHSELAWALREIYERIAVGEVAGIRLEGMEMSLHIPKDSALADPSNTHLDAHSGLLLLEDKDVLLRDLSHPEASPLAHFIREHTPTKPLQKLATKLNVPLNDILYLSEHLIKWRKARAIPPLHPRNTYILQPEAPIEKIAELISVYARKFAALPTLPQMLKVLSGKPIRYGLLIPSRDHRAPYMEILAFLDRYGFVARLQTFGWLRVGESGRGGVGMRGPAKRERPVSGVSLLSPHLRPIEDDDSVSVASEQTVVTTLPAGDGERRQNDDGVPREVLIRDPTDPNKEEAEALDQLLDSVVDAELRERLPQLLEYFDGEHALEDIAVKEGLKRAKAEEWIATLHAEGHLLTFRAA